jgi:hypothetical protein
MYLELAFTLRGMLTGRSKPKEATDRPINIQVVNYGAMQLENKRQPKAVECEPITEGM